MKRLYVFLAVVFAILIALPAQGQIIFGEGHIGFGLNHNSSKNVTNDSTWYSGQRIDGNFTFAPGMGIILTDRLALGLRARYSFTGSRNAGGPPISHHRVHSFGFDPYLNIVLWSKGRFAVTVNAEIGFAVGLHKDYIVEAKGKIGDFIKGTDQTSLSFYIGAVPGMQYLVNEKVLIYTGLNFLSMHYRFTSMGRKDEETGIGSWNHSHSFNGLVNMRNVYSIPQITFGMLWFFNIPKMEE